MKYRFYIALFISFFGCLQVNGQKYNLIIESDERIPEDIIKSYQNFKGDSTAIYSKLETIILSLQNKGFIAASIDQMQFDSVYVYANLYRGQKFYWGKLDLSNLNLTILNRINSKENSNQPINLDALKRIKKAVLSYYENNGYPFAKVVLHNQEIQDSLFNVTVDVDKGDYYLLDSIIVKGDAKISKNYLYRTLKVNPEMVFNQKQINAISKSISDVSFLSEIKPAEIEFKQQQKVDLYLYLQNKKANMFNGIIGFLPDNETTGKLLITGELNLNLVNSFGKGEEIFLNWEKLESSTQQLDVSLMYPYLFRTNLGLDTDFGLYKKDTTFLSLNAGLGLRWFLTYDDYIKLYYRYKNSSRIGNEKSTNILVNYADVKSNILGALYYVNALDYKYNPRKGVEFNVFGGAGFKRISNSNALDDGLNLNADNKTVEIEAGIELNVYYPIYRNFVFHFGNTTRYLDQFVDEDKEAVLFENELYRFGGANSLRGFDESIFYASVYSIQNAEVRYLFEQNSAFYIFWNGAYYYKNVTQVVTEDFPWGFGLGMNFQTKAGIFSLSYALGKQFDNPIEIRTAKIHFGYISRF